MAPSPKLMKLGSFDVFLHEMKEFGNKKRRSVPRTEILIDKVDPYSG